MENVKLPTKAGMLCTIDGDTYESFKIIAWLGDSGALCHIPNDDTGLFNVIDINELIQGSSGNMKAVEKGKLCINV